MEPSIFNKLAEIAQQQAVTTERLVAVIERLEAHLMQMDKDREVAVESIKGHVTTTMEQSQIWWRRALWISVGVVALADLLGMGVERLMQLMNRLP
jgi:hypothetical protein